MVRALALLALLALSLPAQAGEYACDGAQSLSLSRLLANPSAYVDRCLRLHGTVRDVPKAGAVLSDRPGSGIALYFNDDGPNGLDTRAIPLTVVGRVLPCDDIWKNAEAEARRNNAREAMSPHPAGRPEVVYLGMVFGICHYKSDAQALLVTRYWVDQPL
jgi:hypothetical protein